MDPEQVRAEMSARRASIDRKLGLIQKRATESGGQLKRLALRSSILLLVPVLFHWAKRRVRRPDPARSSSI